MAVFVICGLIHPCVHPLVSSCFHRPFLLQLPFLPRAVHHHCSHDHVICSLRCHIVHLPPFRICHVLLVPFSLWLFLVQSLIFLQCFSGSFRCPGLCIDDFCISCSNQCIFCALSALFRVLAPRPSSESAFASRASWCHAHLFKICSRDSCTLCWYHILSCIGQFAHWLFWHSYMYR